MESRPVQASSAAEEWADWVHRNAYPIDLHLDSLSLSLLAGFDFKKGDWTAKKNRFLLWFFWTFFPKGQNVPLFHHVAAPDLDRGKYGGACVTAHATLANLINLPFTDPWNCWLEHKAFVENCVAESDGKYRITRTPEAVKEARKDGVVSFIFCVEGAHVLGHFGRRKQALRLSRLQTLAQAGVAYLTLNHFCNTDISEAGYLPLNGWRKTPNGGLSAFGQRVVRTCIDEGVLIDLTHTSNNGILEVCDICITQGTPVIVSHGASRSLTRGNNPAAPIRLKRTLSDEAICKIVQTGGCISVILAPYFLQIGRNLDGSRKMDADLAFIVEYYDRLARQIEQLSNVEDPWKYLSFGSDFDGGISSIPIGMKSGADLPELTRAMLRAGWPPDRIKNVYSENFLRVWTVARERARGGS